MKKKNIACEDGSRLGMVLLVLNNWPNLRLAVLRDGAYENASKSDTIKNVNILPTEAHLDNIKRIM